MNIVERIKNAVATYGVRGGPQGPAAQHAAARAARPAAGPGAHYDRLREDHPAPRPDLHDLWAQQALGASITRIALGTRHPATFDPQQLHLPVLHAHAPQGAQAPRSRLIAGLLLQHGTQMLLAHAQLLGALCLLGQLKPRAACALLCATDGAATFFNMMVLEVPMGLVVYACVLAVEAGLALGRRMLDAGNG